MRKRFLTFLLVAGAMILFIFTPMQMANSKSLVNEDTSLINQMAEQNFADPDSVLSSSFGQLLVPNSTGGTNETYQGIKRFWNDDLQSEFLPSANHILADWLNNSFIGYLSATISTLSSILKSFFLNPNLTQLANKGNDLSTLLNQLANIVYGVALDLLFLLFIVAVWHYWAKASWNGNISAMSAVGRLICTIGIVIAWPIIYSFEIELSNEMITAIFANSADQLSLLDMVMAGTFKASLYAGASKVITQLIPAANLSTLGMASLGSFLSVIAWLALCILAIILIYQLIYLITLKAIQMALLVAQYVFAPVFIIFFAIPSTEKIATGYIRTFVETSMWTFIWIGLLRILVVLMYASFNPWGKILTAIGILQLMMQVPQFLGRFKISAASQFVNPAFLTSGLREKVNTYTEQAKTYGSSFFGAMQSLLRNDTGQVFNSAGSTMSAEFTFGQRSGYTVERPNQRQPYPQYSPARQPAHTSAYQDQAHTQKSDINLGNGRSSENLTANKNMDVTGVLNNSQTITSQTINSASESGSQSLINKGNGLIKRSSVGQRAIFDRHKRHSSSNSGNSSIAFPSQQRLSDLPVKAAALWDSTGHRQANKSMVANSQDSLPLIEPFRINPFSHGFSAFSKTAGFSHAAYSPNNFPLLASRIMAQKLVCGFSSSVLSKQPLSFKDPINLSGEGFAQNFCAVKSEANKFNQYILGNNQNNNGQNVNYPSSVIPRWQRPRGSGIKQLLLYPKPIHNLSVDAKSFPAAQFRSYYN
jgi:hypothetical protein